MDRQDADVVIVGAGPTGLMLAGDLALAGVKVALLDRRFGPGLQGTRARGLHARSIEILDQRGIAERFIAAGTPAQTAGYAFNRLDISDFPTRHPYGLALVQAEVERLLATWLDALDVPVRAGHEVVALVQTAEGAAVQLADGGRLAARYVVGCDGGRSLVRKAAGIDFPGWDASVSHLLAEVEMTAQPVWGVHRNPVGLHSFGRAGFTLQDGKITFADHGPVQVMVSEAEVGAKADPTLDDLRAALFAACGTDYGAHAPLWISRFTDASRLAAQYRKGRVLLAGDAAHVHGPYGGQGLNTGLQDAVNLGWKLAQVVKGTAPVTLLDSYHAERHPVAARVLQNTMAQAALSRPDPRSEALRSAVAEMLAMEAPRKAFGAMLHALDIHYDLGPGPALLGRRMPDLDLITPDGPLRTYALLHRAAPALVNFGDRPLDMGPWAQQVPQVLARTPGPWELPVLGAVPAPPAVLIRPDGHVAWAGGDGLHEALATWFGPGSGG